MKDKETMKREIRARFIIWILVFGFIASLIVIIICSQYFYGVGIKCIFHEMFGWYCPGCGGTRMAVEVLHGRFYQAFRYNMYVFLTLPFIAMMFIWQSYQFIRYNHIIVNIDKILLWYTFGMCVFTVLRNTEAFSWMAPIIVD